MLESVQAEQSQPSRKDPFELPLAHKLVGDIGWRTGDRAAAMASWKTALAIWPKGVAETPVQLMQRSEMLRGVGQRQEGARIAMDLKGKGYRQSISNRAGI